MRYTCKHGTVHTSREWKRAFEWMSTQYAGKTLETAGFRCWIKEWKQLPSPEGKRPAMNR
jgi:hypothetical protein